MRRGHPRKDSGAGQFPGQLFLGELIQLPPGEHLLAPGAQDSHFLCDRTGSEAVVAGDHHRTDMR